MTNLDRNLPVFAPNAARNLNVFPGKAPQAAVDGIKTVRRKLTPGEYERASKWLESPPE